MILLDSVYINESGGLILLEYLIAEIEKQNLDVYYLCDSRTHSIFSYLEQSRVRFISNSNLERIKFYSKNRNKFTKVLCFGNVPPPVRLKVPVIVYLHQKLFIEIPSDFTFRAKLIYKIKQFVFGFYRNNADMWLVQNELMAKQLADKYFYGDTKQINVMPFYPPLNFLNSNIERIKSSFLYVSNTALHKNHVNLISAFCNAFDKIKEGTLIVTVPNTSVSLCDFIDEKVKLNYPIKNVGFIEREKLINLYLSSEYLIFPSLAESFGLGLVEAIDGGCKVIVSDLPYAYQVCSPSLTFDPCTVDSIQSAIITAVAQELPESNKIITNDINQLILLLSE